MLEAKTEKNRVWGSAGKIETLAEGETPWAPTPWPPTPHSLRTLPSGKVRGDKKAGIIPPQPPGPSPRPP